MSNRGRIAKNTGILMTMELGIRILDAVVAVILARYLAPKGFGLLAFAISFAWLFSSLPGFGMGSLVMRDVSREPRELSRYLSNGLIAKFILALLTLILMGFVAWILGFPFEKILIVFLAGLLMVSDTNMRFTLSFFQAAQRMTTVAIVNLLVRLGWVIGSLAVVGLRGGIVELIGVRIWISLGGFTVSVVLLHFLLQRIRWSFSPAFIWKLIKSSFPFALFHFYGQVYTDVDMVMLSVMRGDVMTGWYAAAQKIFRLSSFIPSSFFQAVLPEMARRTHADLVKATARSARYLMILAMPIAGGIYMIADKLVLLLFGSEYVTAIPVLQILIWSVLFTFMHSAMVASLSAVNREQEGSSVLIYGLLFSGLSNFIAIPLYGHVGAALTTLLGQGLIFLFQVRLLKRELPDLHLSREMAKPFFAMLAMMIFAAVFQERGLAFIILGSAAVYFVSLVALRAVGREEWQILTGLIGGKSDLKPQPVAQGGKTEKQNVDITVHCLVQNEERFIRASIESILPLAKRVLVYDAGSTDATIEIISSIKSDKIEIIRKHESSRKALVQYRNEMMDRTTTEWFMLVDGDEIYASHAVRRMIEEMRMVPSNVDRIKIHRKHFVGSFNFLSRMSRPGRIFRTSRIRFFLKDNWFQTPYLVHDPSIPLSQIPSVEFPRDIFFFHCHYMPRSSKDAELGNRRGWRKPLFPVVPYFGPWPETLMVSGADGYLTPAMVRKWIGLGIEFFCLTARRAAIKIKKILWDSSRERLNPTS